MRRLRYNVASSLDGYIARMDGSFDWIIEDLSIDFVSLFAEFDTLLMGRKTYDALITQKYNGQFDRIRKVVVSSTHPPEVFGTTTFIGQDIVTRIRSLKEQPGRDIWLFGGGKLFRYLLDASLVDTVEIAVMPLLLGNGIPMLAIGQASPPLDLISCESLESGIVMLKYNVLEKAR